MSATFKKKLTAVTAAAVAVIMLFTGCASGTSGDTTDKSGNIVTTAAKTKAGGTTAAPAVINPLTGRAGYDAKYADARPVAVVINNHPSARPQWGFCSPDCVYEYEVEGGITRMLWLYANADEIPDKVGSIRSARHDIVELVLGLNAIFVHWGASNLATDELSQYNIDDINGMTNEQYFARDKSRNVSKEHTGYTTGANVRQAISDLGIRQTIGSSYKNIYSFAPDGSPRALTGGACNSVYFSFSDDYDHTFKYNADDKKYYNYMGSKQMTDSDGNPVTAENVFVLYCQVTDLPNTSLKDYDLTSGSGIYCCAGQYEQISWSKADAYSPLKLFAADGSALIIDPGTSYFGLVRSTRSDKTAIS